MAALLPKYESDFGRVVDGMTEVYQMEAFVDYICGQIRWVEACSREEIEKVRSVLQGIVEAAIQRKNLDYKPRTLNKVEGKGVDVYKRVLIAGPRAEVAEEKMIYTGTQTWEMSYEDSERALPKITSYNEAQERKSANRTNPRKGDKAYQPIRIYKLTH